MNGEIMKCPKGVKSGVPERVSVSCPTYGTRHNHISQLCGCILNKISSR